MFKRKDGRWQEQITLHIGGKKKYKYIYGKTQAEVKRKLLEYQGEQEDGRFFKDVAEEWWEIHQKEIAYNTQISYKPALRRAIDEFGENRLSEIEAQDINRFLLLFSKEYRAKKTVKTQLLVINLIFKYAAANGEIVYNPAAFAKLPGGLTKTQRVLPDPSDIEAVKKHVDIEFGLFAYLLLYTGLRKGEALALQYKDIDRENMMIYVTKSVYYENGRPKIKTPKTEAGNRSIILLDKLSSKIPTRNPNDYLFCTSEGKMLAGKQFERKWEKYKQESGVSCTPHQLRHAYATILYEAGIPAKDAQVLLGHSDVSVTQNIYTHIRNERMNDVREKLNHVNIM